LRATIEAAGFQDVAIKPQLASKHLIKHWIPDSDAERYVVSADITGRRPLAALSAL